MDGHRTAASIEFKYCNISAVMQLLQYPSIRGYKKRDNFQKSLLQEVEKQVLEHPRLGALVQSAVMLPAEAPLTPAFDKVLQMPPSKSQHLQESLAAYAVRSPARRDYLAQEARNRSLGLAGEQFVVTYERWRLQQKCLPGLAEKVEHVAQTMGDGLGFDVRSFDAYGNEKWIEVKTTSFTKDTPFYVTHNELQVSRAQADRFHLYRVYEFRKQPKMFALAGCLDQHCALDPVTFSARF